MNGNQKSAEENILRDAQLLGANLLKISVLHELSTLHGVRAEVRLRMLDILEKANKKTERKIKHK